MNNFNATGADGVSIAATVTSAATALASDAAAKAGRDMLFYNPGPLEVYVKAGAADVVATALSLPVPAGSLVIYRKDNATHVAVICPGGSQAVKLWLGEGS